MRTSNSHRIKTFTHFVSSPTGFEDFGRLAGKNLGSLVDFLDQLFGQLVFRRKVNDPSHGHLGGEDFFGRLELDDFGVLGNILSLSVSFAVSFMMKLRPQL